ncbi:uncharacterized protein LOC126909682, partial [Daktulosphaira vitifoliae]
GTITQDTLTQDTLTQDTIHEQDDEAVPVDDLTNAREQLVSTPGSDKKLKVNKGQKRRLDVITNAVHELKNLNETINSPKTSIQDDECDVMGKHIAIQLRELPPYDRVLANFELQKVLLNYRLKNMREVSPSTSYSRPSSVASNFQLNPYTPQTQTSEESSSRPSSVASNLQLHPYTPQTQTSEENSTADIIHAALVSSDINSDFY